LPPRGAHRTIVAGMDDLIDDVLSADHLRLDGLFHRLEEWPSRGNLDALERGLLPHMDWEEKVLFPALRPGLNAAKLKSLESLEIDHQRIRESLAAIREALTVIDLPLARKRIDLLKTFLKGHNAEEERGLYPDADSALNASERAALLELFRQEPPP